MFVYRALAGRAGPAAFKPVLKGGRGVRSFRLPGLSSWTQPQTMTGIVLVVRAVIHSRYIKNIEIPKICSVPSPHEIAAIEMYTTDPTQSNMPSSRACVVYSSRPGTSARPYRSGIYLPQHHLCCRVAIDGLSEACMRCCSLPNQYRCI